MSNYDENLATSAKVDPGTPKAPIASNVTEGVDLAVEDKTTEVPPDDIDGKAPSGSSVDDDVEYVHGHPVIRNGT